MALLRRGVLDARTLELRGTIRSLDWGVGLHSSSGTGQRTNRSGTDKPVN